MANLEKQLWQGVEKQRDERISEAGNEALGYMENGGSDRIATRAFVQIATEESKAYFNTMGRPVDRVMTAIDAGRVQPVERSLPGLGPTGAELAAQRHIDAAQTRLLPEQRETDRTPIVGQPERMGEAANARLFPMGPSNDDNER